MPIFRTAIPEAIFDKVAAASGSGAAVLIAVLTLATLAVCVVCYTLYYKLEYVASFWDGCVPLALVGAASAVVALALG